MRSVDGDRDGSSGGDGFLQFVLVVLFNVDKADIGGADVLLAESVIYRLKLVFLRMNNNQSLNYFDNICYTSSNRVGIIYKKCNR